MLKNHFLNNDCERESAEHNFQLLKHKLISCWVLRNIFPESIYIGILINVSISFKITFSKENSVISGVSNVADFERELEGFDLHTLAD